MEKNINVENLICGKNEIFEAINAKRSIKKLYVLKGIKDEKTNEIINIAKTSGAIINFLEREKLDNILDTKKHNGIIAEVSDFIYSSVEDILDIPSETNHFIIIMDEIEDPRNVGAIIRTANACGVSGIIIKNRNQCQITPVVMSSSAGAINHMKIARVNNLSNVINELKEKNIWIYGADMEGEDLYKIKLDGNIAIVIGSEGKGISRLVKENCDFLIKIPMLGQINSLNASVAGAVIMYEILRQNKYKNK